MILPGNRVLKGYPRPDRIRPHNWIIVYARMIVGSGIWSIADFGYYTAEFGIQYLILVVDQEQVFSRNINLCTFQEHRFQNAGWNRIGQDQVFHSGVRTILIGIIG